MTTGSLRLTGVTKRYGAVTALEGASLEVARGEVVALVGDNGAGKSTLVKVISGNVAADSATVTLNDAPVSLASVADARELGIATVYQDLALCDNLDVVANLYLGVELRSRGGFLAEDLMESRTHTLLSELSVKIKNLRAPVARLSGGQRQSVAIARCLLTDPNFVILDEPTAALGVAQKEQVIDLVRRLRQRGLGVVLISHNLAEVFAVADRIEVLRLGTNAASLPADPARRSEVLAAITGAGSDEMRGVS